MASCGKCLHKEICVDYRYYKPIAEKCQHFKEFNADKKLQTNADRIRAMTDEELAKTFETDFATCPPNAGEDKWCDKDADCKQCWLDWLKQPAE